MAFVDMGELMDNSLITVAMGVMLSPSERLLLQILNDSVINEALAISDVSVEWSDNDGNRHARSIVTAPPRRR